MTGNSQVVIIQDSGLKNKGYIDLIARNHDVRQININDVTHEDVANVKLIIIQVNLIDPNSILPLKRIMAMPERRNIPALFLLQEFSRREIVQATTLGAADYTLYPCPKDDFIHLIDTLINNEKGKAWEKLSPAQEEALKVSLKVVEKTFHNASKGLEVSQVEVKDSCNLIIEATAKDGLTDWMNAIRFHHDYTYRHSMMVCGYLVSFGMLLQVRKTDLQKLAVGGMMHDIGKAMIPLSILDKPSELTNSEQKTIDK
ncbi:MAG TPA: hypothetical protein ENI91_05535, partial [Sphingomonadales bacterium]|nr:hypothetical protein [Sphingomonadales bacterium]